MRKILIILLGASVGLGVLLAGCRVSDGQASADRANHPSPDRIAVAEIDAGAQIQAAANTDEPEPADSHSRQPGQDDAKLVSDERLARSLAILEKEKAMLGGDARIWSREEKAGNAASQPAPRDLQAMAPAAVQAGERAEIPPAPVSPSEQATIGNSEQEVPGLTAMELGAAPVQVPPLPPLPPAPPPAGMDWGSRPSTPEDPFAADDREGLAMVPPPQAPAADLPETDPEAPGLVTPEDFGITPIAEDGDEATPPGPEQPLDPQMDKARRLLEEETARERLVEDTRQADAHAHFLSGMNLFNKRLYADALRAFEEALERDPGHQEARRHRETCRSLLGDPARDSAEGLGKRLQEREIAIRRSMEAQTRSDMDIAAKLLDRSLHPSEIQQLKPVDKQIQEALRDLEEAADKLTKVETALVSSPTTTLMIKDMRLEARALKEQVIASRKQFEAQREALDRERARQDTIDQKAVETSIHRERLRSLLESAEFHYGRREYDKARDLAMEVQKMDPHNPDASDMIQRARAEAHRKAEIDNARDMDDAERNWVLDVRKAAIQPSEELVYPEDWDQIKRRVIRQREVEGGSMAEKQIRDRLEAVRVTVDYNETPIADVLRELQEKGGINIVRNTDVEPDTPVSLTVTNMSLAKVLEWIMSLTELHYEIRNEAIYVSREIKRRLILQLYPIFDLIRPMQNYYPGDDDDDDDEEDEGITDIRERITRVVAPEHWGEGETLEIWEDNLLVMQTPEVHAKLVSYLDRLREAAKQQILVEGRFINITGGYLEEIGIYWNAETERRGMPAQPRIRDGRGIYMRRTDDGRELTTAASILPGSAAPGGDTAREGLRMLLAYLSLQSPTSAIAAGPLRHLEANAILHALQETQQASVLHNPRLLVANGRNAFLEIYTTTSYVSNWTQQGAVFQPEVSQYQQGVAWSVRPVISFDRKYITIRVRPRVVAFDPHNSRTISNTRMQAVATAEANTLVEPIPLEFMLPVLETTELESFVTIPDGGTVLMGGLIHDERSTNISGVPLLSSMPIVGRVFRSERRENDQRNLVIMVQGKIIELDS